MAAFTTPLASATTNIGANTGRDTLSSAVFAACSRSLSETAGAFVETNPLVSRRASPVVIQNAIQATTAKALASAIARTRLYSFASESSVDSERDAPNNALL